VQIYIYEQAAKTLLVGDSEILGKWLPKELMETKAMEDK
jgi:hypothetical protein